MIQIQTKVLNYRIRIQIRKRRGGFVVPSFISDLQSIRNIKSGSRFSRLFRLIFERLNLKTFLGGNLALFVMLSGVIQPSMVSKTNVSVPEEVSLKLAPETLLTPIRIQYPISKITVTQGYSLFHLAVDLGDAIGDPVKPIMNGKVVYVEYSHFSYGNHIIIDHENGYKSLYAHLSKINVVEGQDVATSDVIGLVGSTGHSTGPHLHLEIYKSGRPLNPLAVLPR